jgi:hypothetical protein
MLFHIAKYSPPNIFQTGPFKIIHMTGILSSGWTDRQMEMRKQHPIPDIYQTCPTVHTPRNKTHVVFSL